MSTSCVPWVACFGKTSAAALYRTGPVVLSITPGSRKQPQHTVPFTLFVWLGIGMNPLTFDGGTWAEGPGGDTVHRAQPGHVDLVGPARRELQALLGPGKEASMSPPMPMNYRYPCANKSDLLVLTLPVPLVPCSPASRGRPCHTGRDLHRAWI